MAFNTTQTKYFSSGDISFSQIKNTFGGNANNIKASDYLRNVGSNVDWESNQIIPKVPDSTENAAVSTGDDWSTSSLRNTIKEYNVIQSGNNEELSFTSADTGTWNGNLNRNILKNFSITGTVYANQTNKYALEMSGDLYNLEIDVESDNLVKIMSEDHDSFYMLDANENPVLIDSPHEFLGLLKAKNQEALNTYHQACQQFTSIR